MKAYLDNSATTKPSAAVAAVVSEMLEKIPAVGDTFDYQNLTVLVQLVADRKVERVLVVIKEIEEPEE